MPQGPELCPKTQNYALHIAAIQEISIPDPGALILQVTLSVMVFLSIRNVYKSLGVLSNRIWPLSANNIYMHLNLGKIKKNKELSLEQQNDPLLLF